MKRTFCIALIVLFPLVFMSFSNNKTQEKATLKVMTYNIWNGFNWGKDTIRKANCIKWIQDKNPDVLALQELCGYNEAQLKADAAKWGHSYVKI